MTVQILQTKLQVVLAECKGWLNKKVSSKKQFQAIAGKLQHVAKCVKSARVFMSRIFAAIRAAPSHGNTR